MNITDLKAAHFDLGRVPVHRAVVSLLGGIIANLEAIHERNAEVDAQREKLDLLLMNVTGTATVGDAIAKGVEFFEAFAPELSAILGNRQPRGQCEGCSEAAQDGRGVVSADEANAIGQAMAEAQAQGNGQGLSMGQALDGITLDNLPEGPADGKGQQDGADQAGA